MKYVIDTNIFSQALNNLSFQVFAQIWIPWAELMKKGRIVSVDEVYCELSNHWNIVRNKVKHEKWQWIVDHKDSFGKPSNDECQLVSEIFRSKKFQEGVKERSLRNGTPEADAFLVAKAKRSNGIIVTAEIAKPNSEKVPNIADGFDVPYMSRDEFYKMITNVHFGRNEFENVMISYPTNNLIKLEEYKNYKKLG